VQAPLKANVNPLHCGQLSCSAANGCAHLKQQVSGAGTWARHWLQIKSAVAPSPTLPAQNTQPGGKNKSNKGLNKFIIYPPDYLFSASLAASLV
jgi:hypothetical protein